MATEFTMPKLGLTMEEGTIVEWLVPDGAAVEDGSAVLVVQTDKVETEVNVVGSGRLAQVGAVGATFACGEPIGWLLAEGEEAPSAAPARNSGADREPATLGSAVSADRSPPPVAATNGAPGGRIIASPYARRLAAERGIDLAAVRGTGPGGRIVAEDLDGVAPAAARPAAVSARAAAVSARPPAVAGGTPATFAARALADLLGIDVSTVPPDARDGRVSRDDVARHVRSLLAAASAPAAAAPPPAASQVPTEVVPIRGMRGTIAKRMHSSLREMAQLTLTVDADMDAVVADRDARKAAGSPPGYTDYVLAAAGRALREHPIVNAQVTPGGIALLPDVHVGLAVAVDGGLVVPVVLHADRRPLADIASDTTRLAAAARAGTLKLDELEGGTFSVSALGMFGVDAFTPVINPPNVAILGVGRIRDDLALVDGEVTVRRRMTLSLTWDHRVLDGAPAAAFAQSIVAKLQDPAALD